MTKAVRTLYFSLIMTLSCGLDLSADGLLMALPEDGTQVSYSVKVTADNPPPAGYQMSLTISSVGKAMHEGEPCRWIEIGFLSQVGEMRRDRFYKLLIPEAHLKAGSTPIEHVVKAYLNRGDGEAVEDKDFASPARGPLPVLLAGPLKGGKKLEATSIDTGLGKLECAGSKGTLAISETRGDEGDETKFTLSVDMEARYHKKVPFGVAKMILAFTAQAGDTAAKQTGVLTFTADKISTGAKSAMPDAK